MQDNETYGIPETLCLVFDPFLHYLTKSSIVTEVNWLSKHDTVYGLFTASPSKTKSPKVKYLS